MSEQLNIKTLKVRIKDKHAAELARMAGQVNQVWNFVNETSARAIQEKHQFMTGYDLQKYTAGYSRCDGVLLRSGTVDMVCAEYAARRRQHKKARLAWRVSNQKSARRSLGWIPFKQESIRFVNGQLRYGSAFFSLWDSYGLSEVQMRSGSFSEDARGRWYFNVAVQVAAAYRSDARSAVGVDLGLKATATTSDGQVFDGRHFRASESKLASAQRAGKKRLARTIHAKIKNQRKDGQHKFSTALVRDNAAIFVGDVSSKAMLKTRLAKSTSDAGWHMLKKMLAYKSHQAGIIFAEVNEAYSTQTCSSCGSVEGPKGVAGLGIRGWTCSCGSVHDRDVNAARNILRAGLRTLAEGAEA